MAVDPASLIAGEVLALPGLLLTAITVILYVYAVYSIILTFKGFRSILLAKKSNPAARLADQPFISIVVPARNEERVIGATLQNLTELEYPGNKWEVIVVEDQSVDRTREIIASHAMKHHNIRYLRSSGGGKPGALNQGSKVATGEILLFIDADSRLRKDALMTGAAYLANGVSSALIGYPFPLNYGESVITKGSVYEIIMWDLLIKGKQSWNLFLPLTGFGMFIRKGVLEEVGMWDEGALAEDTELAVRMTLSGHRVTQAPIYNWLEFPPTARALIRQRVRWYRGGIEAFLKHKTTIVTNLKAIPATDVVLTLLGSIPGALLLIAYASVIAVIPQAIANNTTLLPFLVGIGLYQILYISLLVGVISTSYPRGTRVNLVKRIPISYYYSILLSLASMKAIFDVLFRRPKVWARSVKTGMIDPLVPSPLQPFTRFERRLSGKTVSSPSTRRCN